MVAPRAGESIMVRIVISAGHSPSPLSTKLIIARKIKTTIQTTHSIFRNSMVSLLDLWPHGATRAWSYNVHAPSPRHPFRDARRNIGPIPPFPYTHGHKAALQCRY